MNTNSCTHEHMLRTFYHLAIHAQEIRSFKCLVYKIIKTVITVIDNSTIKLIRMLADHSYGVLTDETCFLRSDRIDIIVQGLHCFTERLVGILMKIRNGNTCGK